MLLLCIRLFLFINITFDLDYQRPNCFVFQTSEICSYFYRTMMSIIVSCLWWENMHYLIIKIHAFSEKIHVHLYISIQFTLWYQRFLLLMFYRYIFANGYLEPLLSVSVLLPSLYRFKSKMTHPNETKETFHNTFLLQKAYFATSFTVLLYNFKRRRCHFMSNTYPACAYMIHVAVYTS